MRCQVALSGATAVEVWLKLVAKFMKDCSHSSTLRPKLPVGCSLSLLTFTGPSVEGGKRHSTAETWLLCCDVEIITP